jgi:DNA methylase
MLADAIKDVTARNGIVLDVFGGSGSTLIAAHKTGRRARIAELDPVYVDRIVRRWQAYASDDAVLKATGETFEQGAAATVRTARSSPRYLAAAEMPDSRAHLKGAQR